jgi:hypothetical protein
MWKGKAGNDVQELDYWINVQSDVFKGTAFQVFKKMGILEGAERKFKFKFRL